MNVYLLSTIGCDHLTIIPHFIEHYLTIGIRPDRFLITLNAKSRHDPALDQAIAILKQYGIKSCNFYIGNYNVPDEKRHSQAVKNKFTKPEDWIVCCDADEFQQYPLQNGDISAFLSACEEAGYNLINGELVDRISATGRLAAITPSPPLCDQFPVDCQITFRLGGACPAKVMAHRSAINTSYGNHYPDPERADWYQPYPRKLRVYHFKWDASAIARLEYHASRLAEPYPPVESKRFLDHIRKYGRIDLQNSGVLQQMRPLVLTGTNQPFHIDVMGERPTAASVGERFQFEAAVHNFTNSWLSSHDPNPVHLACHWLFPDGSMAVFESERTRLIPPIRPQDKERFVVNIQAPQVPGAYHLQPTLVQENVMWLDSAVSTAPLPINVGQVRRPHVV